MGNILHGYFALLFAKEENTVELSVKENIVEVMHVPEIDKETLLAALVVETYLGSDVMHFTLQRKVLRDPGHNLPNI